MALEDLDAKATDSGVGDDGDVDANAPDDGGGGVSRGLVLMAFMSSLSGFIIGYDQSIIATCMNFISEELHVTMTWHQTLVGGIYIMGTVTSLFAGLLTDRLGRWIVIVISSVAYLAAAVVMATAQNRPQILISRLLVGFSCGLSTMSAPVFMSECSPSRLRGRITTIYTFMIAVAMTVANLTGAPFATTPNGWRYMIGLGSIAALIQLVGFSFIPESPRWLVMKGRVAEAQKALKYLRTPSDNWEDELNEIKHTVAQNANKRGFALIFKTATVRRALVVGVLLHVAQPVSGSLTIIVYSIVILKKAGVSNTLTAMFLWSALMGVATVGYALSLWLVEKVGRRPLVLASLVGLTLGLMIVGIIFNMIHIHGPSIQMPSDDPECQVETCGLCTSRRHCGMCYTGELGNEQDTSCVAVDPNSFYKASFSGLCSNKTLLEEGAVTFAYDWCPYRNAWVILVGFALYFLLYAIGIAPLSWTMASEIFPGWARSTATSITTATNWLFNMLLVLNFLSLSEAIFTHGVFYLLMSINVVLFLAFLFILPETKGVSLEDVETLFSKPLGDGIIINAPRIQPVGDRS